MCRLDKFPVPPVTWTSKHTMNWFGGGSTPTAPADSSTNLSSDGGAGSELHSDPAKEMYNQPVLALDRLKHAGVPLKAQMTPYLQVSLMLNLSV